jgi:H/ACA ribonucleoprotein complex non-core subunit NAF1
MPIPAGGWEFQQSQMHPQQQYNFGTQPPFVQPHINPRFASQFGMNVGLLQPQLYSQYGQYESNATNARSSTGNWVDQWTVPVHGGNLGGADADRAAGDQFTHTP